MKTFNQWLKENLNCEMPEGDVVDANWFFKQGLPMIVECASCKMTMAVPNAYIDDKGYTYCSSCAEV